MAEPPTRQPAVSHLQPFVRNRDAGDLLEIFFVSAVSSIILMRFILHLTGYPQLGGDGLHIAHVLPGGLLMMIALVILLSYLNRGARPIAALVGGVGFGLFMDELGKFLTSDTNYFFQPTFALLYIMFIVLFFVFRTIGSFTKLSHRSALLNALELSKDSVIHDLDAREKRQVLKYLKEADPNDPLTKALTAVMRQAYAPDPREPGVVSRSRQRLADFYVWVIEQRWFGPVLITVFVVGSLSVLAQMAVGIRFDDLTLTPSEIGRLLPSTVSAVLVLIGAVRLTHSRLAAFEMFRLALLVSVFFTQIFVFYLDQLSGVIGLAVNLLGLVTLQYMIRQEKQRV